MFKNSFSFINSLLFNSTAFSFHVHHMVPYTYTLYMLYNYIVFCGVFSFILYMYKLAMGIRRGTSPEPWLLLVCYKGNCPRMVCEGTLQGKNHKILKMTPSILSSYLSGFLLSNTLRWTSLDIVSNYWTPTHLFEIASGPFFLFCFWYCVVDHMEKSKHE